MQPIRFLTDDEGHRFAMIDLDRVTAGDWEDLHDQIVLASRADEKPIPWNTVKRRLAQRRGPRKRTARG